MTKQKRMIANIIAEAEKNDVAMPWTRGARRTAWIAKRTMQMTPLKTARS